jgi:imidazolonepropionase-like amidohydrolase
VPEVLAAMAKHGTILVPTLSVFDHVAESDAYPAWMRDRGRRLGESARLTVEAARKQGVAIAMGADAPPHGGNAQELVRLADAGLTPLEALAAATGVAARACRVDRQVGTVEPGKVADLVAVDGNPLTDRRSSTTAARPIPLLAPATSATRPRILSSSRFVDGCGTPFPQYGAIARLH